MRQNHEDQHAMMKFLGTMYQKYDNDQMQDKWIEEGNVPYECQEFVVDIRRILSLMPPLYREIIENDFLCIQEANWWQNKYDEKTYLELKNLAIKVFFHCLYV